MSINIPDIAELEIIERAKISSLHTVPVDGLLPNSAWSSKATSAQGIIFNPKHDPSDPKSVFFSTIFGRATETEVFDFNNDTNCLRYKCITVGHDNTSRYSFIIQKMDDGMMSCLEGPCELDIYRSNGEFNINEYFYIDGYQLDDHDHVDIIDAIKAGTLSSSDVESISMNIELSGHPYKEERFDFSRVGAVHFTLREFTYGKIKQLRGIWE